MPSGVGVPDVEGSDMAAITLEGLTEMDEPGPGTTSEWEETR